MSKQILYNLICRYFQYLYGKVLHFNDYCFDPSENQKKQINNFIDYLDKQVGLQSIGEEWIFNYLVFSFKQRSEQKTRFNGKFLPLNLIIGKKAFQLYEKRGKSWLYWNDQFMKGHNISFDGETALNELKTKDFKDELRKQYYKDVHPLHLCLWTVEYSKKSKYCLQCKDKKSCKIINQ